MKIFLAHIVFCSTLLVSGFSMAEEGGNYWVVGSYQNQAEAIEQGERLSGVTGVEVLMLPMSLEGQTIYRLLVRLFTDQYDQQRLKAQLKYSGVTDVWATEIRGDEPGLRSLFAVVDYGGEVRGSTSSKDLDSLEDYQIQDFADERVEQQPVSIVATEAEGLTAEQDNFIVLGSYRELDSALNQQVELSGQLGEVYVKKALVNGVSYHRVLAGPVSAAAEAGLIRQASELGIPNAWVWRGVRVEGAMLGEPDEVTAPEQVFSPDPAANTAGSALSGSPARSATLAEDKITGQNKSETDDFNLAKLKKTSGPYFLPERN